MYFCLYANKIHKKSVYTQYFYQILKTISEPLPKLQITPQEKDFTNESS